MNYCPRTGKAMYRKSREAKRVLREIQRRKKRPGASKRTSPIHVYQCEWCGAWHLTSRKQLPKAA